MKQLDWLPIRARIEFKELLLVHKCLQKKVPLYQRNLIDKSECRREGLSSSEDAFNTFGNSMYSQENLCLAILQCLWTSAI